MGYRNIKIYNGGIKDWKKSNYRLEVIEPLPKYEFQFITSEDLLTTIKQAEAENCRDQNDKPFLTILDLRTEHFLNPDKPLSYIESNCATINSLFDELANSEVRGQIPKEGLVVTITETGNRDKFAMQFLFKHGYTNVMGLQFGMRGWIKQNYPQTTRQ